MSLQRGQLLEDNDIEHNHCILHILDKYELTVDTPCPALTGAPWDVYFELCGDKVQHYVGIWLYVVVSGMAWCCVPARDAAEASVWGAGDAGAGLRDAQRALRAAAVAVEGRQVSMGHMAQPTEIGWGEISKWF